MVCSLSLSLALTKVEVPSISTNVCHGHIMRYRAFSFQQYIRRNNLSRIPIRELYQIGLQSWLASLCILFSAMTNKCPSYRAVCNRLVNLVFWGMIVKLQYKVGVFLLNTLYNELNVIMKIKWFLKMLPVLYLTDYHSPKHQVHQSVTNSPIARALIGHRRKEDAQTC